MRSERRMYRIVVGAVCMAVVAVCFGDREGGRCIKLDKQLSRNISSSTGHVTSTVQHISSTRYSSQGTSAAVSSNSTTDWTSQAYITTTQAPNANDDCSQVHSQNASDTCRFVKTTDDCQIDEGIINYNVFIYCSFTYLVPLGVFILFLWWLFLFVLLAVAADEFFCPSLVVIAKTLRLSDNIAGVTLLAFGNGAPDVFSAIAAVKGAKNGDAGLAFGALLGAGVFVTSVVTGAIGVIKPFHLMERPFLRDVIFYIMAVFMTFVYLYNGRINTMGAVGFILMYVVYVVVVIVGRTIYQRQKRKRQQMGDITADPEREDDPEDQEVHTRQHIIHDGLHHHASAEPEDSDVTAVNDSRNINEDDVALLQPQKLLTWRKFITFWKDFLKGINPIDVEGWPEKSKIGKIYEVFKAIPYFMLKVTAPVVDYEQEGHHNWNKSLQVFHCVAAPLFGIFAASNTAALYKMGGVFPVWVLIFFVGIIFAVIVLFTSKREERPVYHWVFAYVGFGVALIWIEAVANEIVNILQTFGIVMNISSAVLGLTLLAWGNSLGDLVADTVMARQGYPRTGISACFGGPMFNLLMGVGIPFTIRCAGSPHGYTDIKFTLIQVVLVAGLLFSLISSMLAMLFLKFHMTRPYGIYLFCLYALFMLIAILVETNVIQGQV